MSPTMMPPWLLCNKPDTDDAMRQPVLAGPPFNKYLLQRIGFHYVDI
jgi:hypothetical protein